MKIISNNKKAYHNYFIEDTYEAGIVLVGTEVKSLRVHTCSLSESICKIIGGECFIFGMNISPYEQGNIWNVDATRTRKLLLHKKEILKINDKLKQKGYTLIPLKAYFSKGKVKIEIGLCKGKKLYDKKEDLKKKTMQREIERSQKV